MAISEVKMRKTELEDITNTNKKFHFKQEKKDKKVSFENYLLTPKEEDFDSKDFDTKDFKDFNKLDECQDLDRNPDYIALASSLRLLKSNKEKISKEIVELSTLLNHFKQSEDEKEILQFLNKLLTNQLKLPKQNKILKCPMIRISKYEPKPLKMNLNEKPLFKTLNLFKSS